MKNKLLIAFFLIVVLLFGGIFYINRVFIPVHFKQIVIDQAKEHLNRNITLENLHFSLLSGLSVDDLNIYQKDNPDKLLVHFDRATIGVNLLSIAFQQKFVVPSVELINPSVYVLRDKKGAWSFQDLIPNEKSSSKKTTTEDTELPNVIIERLVLENGVIHFDDAAITPALKEKVIIKSLRASLSLHRGANFMTDITLPNINGNIKVEGSFNPFTQKGDIELAIQSLPLSRYWPYAAQENMNLSSALLHSLNIETTVDGSAIDVTGNAELRQLDFSDEANHIVGDIKFNDFAVNWNNGLNNLKGHLNWNNVEATLLNDYSFTGDIKTTIESAGFSEQHQFFKGSFRLKDIDADAGSYGSFRGDLHGKGVSFNMNDNVISVLGDITMNDAKVTSEYGDMQVDSISIDTLDVKQDGADLAVSANVDVNTLAVTTEQNQSIQGDFAWTDGTFTLDENKNININGDILMRQGMISLDDNKIIKGNLTASRIQANIKQDQTITAKAASVTFAQTDVQYDGHQVQGDIKLNNIASSMNNGVIDVTGDVSINQANINLASQQTLTGDIALQNLNLNLNKQKITSSMDVILNNITFHLDEQKKFRGTIQAQNTSLMFDQPKVAFKSNIMFEQTHVTYDNYTFSGNPAINIDYTGNLNTPLDGKYAGTINLSQAHVNGLPQINQLSNINTAIVISKDKALIKNLTFNALGTPVKLAGAITEFTSPSADINIETEVIKLATIKPFIKAQLEEQQIELLSGETKIVADFDGKLDDPLSGNIDAIITMDDIGIQSNKLEKTLSNLSGTIRAKNDQLIFESVEGLVDGRKLIVDGSVNQFDQPVINASLNVDGLINAKIDAVKRDNTVRISSLNVSAYESQVAVNGSIQLEPDQPPFINLAIQSTVDTEDAIKIAPWMKEQIEPLKLRGAIHSTGSVKGYVDNWTMLDSTINVNAPYFSALGYKANNINIKATQSEGKVEPLNVTANVYDGLVETFSTIDLTNSAMPFDSSIRINRIDISKFIKDFPSLRTNNVAGWFSSEASLNGLITDPLNMNGNGSLEITEGYLREIKVFKGMMAILNPLLSLDQDIVITAAQSNFTLKDQKVTVENAILSSTTVGFEANGWVGFDKTIDMTIDPQVSGAGLGGYASANAIPMDVALPSVRVFNTIMDPKYDYDISAGKMIEKTLQNTVGTLIEGLFN